MRLMVFLMNITENICNIKFNNVFPIEPVDPKIAIFFFIYNLNFTKSKIQLHESRLDKLLEIQKSYHLYDLKFLHVQVLIYLYLLY